MTTSSSPPETANGAHPAPGLPDSGLQPVPLPGPPRHRPDPDDEPLPEEIIRAQEREARRAERERGEPASTPRRRGRPPAAAPPPAARPSAQATSEQLNAGKLVELLQDVQAGTPVWQEADEGDDRDLVPVFFVEVLKVNGVVERLVIR